MGLLDLLFVHKCRVCNEIIPHGAVCDKCNKLLLEAVDVKSCNFEVLDKTLHGKYLFEYDNPIVKKLVFALKRSADRELFEYFAELYMTVLPKDFSGVITNVPRRKASVREYGYDHVARICKTLAKMSRGKIRYVPLLKRTGFSKEQKNLTEKERIKNTKGKFKLKNKDTVNDILLVDDIVTTGNTVISCAKVVLDAKPEARLRLAFFAS